MTSQIWAVYATAVGFLLHCIYAFSSQSDRLALEGPMAIALLVTSLGVLVTGAAGTYQANSLCRCFRFVMVAVWVSESVYLLTYNFSSVFNSLDNPEKNTIVPGYIGVMVVMVVLSLLGLVSNSNEMLIQCCCYLLAIVFGIASNWNLQHLLPSVGACYVILCSISCVIVVRRVIDLITTPPPPKQCRSLNAPGSVSTGDDYVMLYQALNVICSAVYASLTFLPRSMARFAYSWFVSAALVQLVCSVLLSRKGNTSYTGAVGLSGAVWLSVGYYLAVELFDEATLPLVAIQVCLILLFLVISVVYASENVFMSIQSLTFVAIAAVRCTDSELAMSVVCWVMFAISCYGMIAMGLKLVNFRFQLPQGLSMNVPFLGSLSIKQRVSKTSNTTEQLSKMGYTKYSDFSSVGFLSNCLASVAVAWVPVGTVKLLILPWTLGIGGILQMAVGFISFSRGFTFESCSHFLMASFWCIWGTLRALDVDNGGLAEGVGCISFLLVCLIMIVLSSSISKAWIVQWLTFTLVVISHLLTAIGAHGHVVFSCVISVMFALVSFYCFVATTIPIVPTGAPLLNVSYVHSQSDHVIWADANKISGITAIAELLNDGRVVGLPTDTVYVLVAACKHPLAVQRAYQTKKQADHRPMSVWISSLEQIDAGRGTDFSPLLWDFMCAVWPSSISLVVNRGAWVSALGMGDSSEYVGKPDSIAVRMPDTTAINHLVEMTGPIAVTSANPSGEADTTHHLQVLAKLGAANCDGVLCDGSSAENIASTVVDCRKIDEHKLGFFRVGLVPKSRVMEIYEPILERHVTSSADADAASVDSGVDGYASVGGSSGTVTPKKLRGSGRGSGRSSTRSLANSIRRKLKDSEANVLVHNEENGAGDLPNSGLVNDGFLCGNDMDDGMHTPMTSPVSARSTHPSSSMNDDDQFKHLTFDLLNRSLDPALLKMSTKQGGQSSMSTKSEPGERRARASVRVVKVKPSEDEHTKL